MFCLECGILEKVLLPIGIRVEERIRMILECLKMMLLERQLVRSQRRVVIQSALVISSGILIAVTVVI